MVFQVSLLGDPDVGKSSLVKKMANDYEVSKDKRLFDKCEHEADTLR